MVKKIIFILVFIFCFSSSLFAEDFSFVKIYSVSGASKANEQIIRMLKKAGMEYRYYNVSVDPKIENEMHERMDEFHPDLDYFTVPIVDFGHTVFLYKDKQSFSGFLALQIIEQNNLKFNADLTIYGRTTCGLTNYLLKWLDDVGFKYNFKNVDKKENNKQMWEYVNLKNPDLKKILLPVVVLGVNILITPDALDVVNILINNGNKEEYKNG